MKTIDNGSAIWAVLCYVVAGWMFALFAAQDGPGWLVLGFLDFGGALLFTADAIVRGLTK